MIFMDQDSYKFSFADMDHHDEYRADMTFNVDRDWSGYVKSILLDVVVTASTTEGNWTKAISVPVTWTEAFMQALSFEQCIPSALKALEEAVFRRSRLIPQVDASPDLKWDGILDISMLDALEESLSS